MEQRKTKPIGMRARIYFRDALKAAVESLHQKFPHHTITGFEETGQQEVLECFTVNHGYWTGCYDHWPCMWEFMLEKQDPSEPGAWAIRISIHPTFDVIFKDEDRVFYVEIGFDRDVTLLPVAGTEGSFVDAFVFYNPDGEL
jgi:hypothetical protein